MSAVHRIAIETRPGETRVALLDENNTPLQFLIERDHDRSLVGGVYLGRVAAVRPGIGAAFIDLGTAADGFLNVKEGARDVCGTVINEGAAILVQVMRDAEGSKGPSLSLQIDIAGTHMVMTPGKSGIGVSKRITDDAARARIRACFDDLNVENIGFVARTTAEHIDDDGLKSEAQVLLGKWQALQEEAGKGTTPSVLRPSKLLAERVITDWVRADTQEIVVDTSVTAQVLRDTGNVSEILRQSPKGPAFADVGIADAFENALMPTVLLSSGGSIIVTETPAMTTVDVNAGRGHSGDAERLARDVNIEAAEATARAVRQRNIGGLIAIDFIRMKKQENRDAVLSALRKALADNPRGPRVGDFSPFGLVDVVCRRDGKSLSEQYLSRNEMKSGETVAIEMLAALDARRGASARVRVSRAVGDALRGPLANSVKSLEDRLGFAIDIEIVDLVTADHYEIMDNT